MNPRFSITEKILDTATQIAEMTGEIDATSALNKNPTLRRKNRIQTIYGSLCCDTIDG